MQVLVHVHVARECGRSGLHADSVRPLTRGRATSQFDSKLFEHMMLRVCDAALQPVLVAAAAAAVQRFILAAVDSEGVTLSQSFEPDKPGMVQLLIRKAALPEQPQGFVFWAKFWPCGTAHYSSLRTRLN